jgi:hypothetical protein
MIKHIGIGLTAVAVAIVILRLSEKRSVMPASSGASQTQGQLPETFSTRRPMSGPEPASRPSTSEATRFDVNFSDVWLDEAFAYIRRHSNLSIAVNWRGLRNQGLRPSTAVNLQVRNVTGREALQALLTVLDHEDEDPLGYVVLDNDVILILSNDDLRAVSRELRVYDVRDLILENASITDQVARRIEEARSRLPATTQKGTSGFFGDGRSTDQHLADALLQLITELIDAESWQDVGGGDGSIRYWAGRLVIHQTAENHGQIEQLLNDLRHPR